MLPDDIIHLIAEMAVDQKYKIADCLSHIDPSITGLCRNRHPDIHTVLDRYVDIHNISYDDWELLTDNYNAFPFLQKNRDYVKNMNILIDWQDLQDTYDDFNIEDRDSGHYDSFNYNDDYEDYDHYEDYIQYDVDHYKRRMEEITNELQRDRNDRNYHWYRVELYEMRHYELCREMVAHPQVIELIKKGVLDINDADLERLFSNPYILQVDEESTKEVYNTVVDKLLFINNELYL
jgi:hypothetical protein